MPAEMLGCATLPHGNLVSQRCFKSAVLGFKVLKSWQLVETARYCDSCFAKATNTLEVLPNVSGKTASQLPDSLVGEGSMYGHMTMLSTSRSDFLQPQPSMLKYFMLNTTAHGTRKHVSTFHWFVTSTCAGPTARTMPVQPWHDSAFCSKTR